MSHPAEFVLLGSMNPEEGLLRPQLLDRFALSVDIAAPLDPGERQAIVERRISFERDPAQFAADWSSQQQALREKISAARDCIGTIVCSTEILAQISTTICEKGVRSLRADLAAVRASIACAALMGHASVGPDHIDLLRALGAARAHNRSWVLRQNCLAVAARRVVVEGGLDRGSSDLQGSKDTLHRVLRASI